MIISAMCPQVVIVPQPASTCAAAVCSAAPRLSPQNITVLSRLAHNRLTQQVPKFTLSEVLVHLADQERHDLLHPVNAAIHAESAAALEENSSDCAALTGVDNESYNCLCRWQTHWTFMRLW